MDAVATLVMKKVEEAFAGRPDHELQSWLDIAIDQGGPSIRDLIVEGPVYDLRRYGFNSRLDIIDEARARNAYC